MKINAVTLPERRNYLNVLKYNSYECTCATVRGVVLNAHRYNKARKHIIFPAGNRGLGSPMQTRLKGKRIHPRIDIHCE